VTYVKTRDSIRSESEALAFGGKAPEPHYDEVWEPASAHETRQHCMDHIGLAKDLLPYVKYFKCLPDTIDPRGAKAR
jgi:hypothetical protein